MEMGTPKAFGVVTADGRQDLLPSLQAKKVNGKRTYTARYDVRRPGDHVFYVEPAPYWEPAEQKMIVHYTKVVVNAMGKTDAWDRVAGLPVEIEPLVQPYNLWTGNTFRGRVLRQGKPVPFAEIEVEYKNPGTVGLPHDVFETQVIKADADGVFAYALPRAGWWAFAALVDGDKPMTNPDGEQVDVELGGLIWVHATDMPEKRAR